jgi:cell wall-associated NlpC family hydrolase
MRTTTPHPARRPLLRRLRTAAAALLGIASVATATGAALGPSPSVASVPPPQGYWTLASSGDTTGFGAASTVTGPAVGGATVAGFAMTPSGFGSWVVTTGGAIVARGDATSYGSAGGLRLNRPIVGMAATPSGLGYWLVATDGGIFSYGDARFFGSTGALRLNRPVVGMAASPTGRGYWLVASDGGIFNYGDAPFLGSTVTATSSAVAIAGTTATTVTRAGRAVQFAIDQLGDPYLYGGTGPNAWDCSGLVQAAYAAAGVTLPRTSEAQYAALPRLPAGATLQPGDLVFFGTAADVHHVGIYVGNGQMIDAPHPGTVVRLDPIARSDAMGASRPAP